MKSTSLPSEKLMPAVVECRLLLERGEYDRACCYVEGLLRLDPGNASYHMLLAGTLLTAGRLKEAREALRAACRECRAEDAPAFRPLHRLLAERLFAGAIERLRRERP